MNNESVTLTLKQKVFAKVDFVSLKLMSSMESYFFLGLVNDNALLAITKYSA